MMTVDGHFEFSQALLDIVDAIAKSLLHALHVLENCCEWNVALISHRGFSIFSFFSLQRRLYCILYSFPLIL